MKDLINNIPVENNYEFKPAFSYKLIYVFRINDEKHKWYLKIWEATVHTSKSAEQLTPNCKELKQAACKRIDDYTSTAWIEYELLHTELAVFYDKSHWNKFRSFKDKAVHEVLERSGKHKHFFDTNRKQNEWYPVDLETAKQAISAVKDNRKSLTPWEITKGRSPIIFRPEQQAAIKQTIQQYKHSNRMLWNAKMRFWKTLTCLQVVKELQFKKTIIITHKPVVDDWWYEDFDKIFYDQPNYAYSSKKNWEDLHNLLKSDKSFVYFASLQDLRGSIEVWWKFEKNDDVFNTAWDFVVTDEAHEWTQTELWKAVRDRLINENNKELSLSWTPFNLFDDYDEDSTYTWDYIMEQQAKLEWIKSYERFWDSNPYEDLPRLNIFTYHLENVIKWFMDIEDKAFNFREFFRVWTWDIHKDLKQIPEWQSVWKFIHEKEVKQFLDLLCSKNKNTNYPFSTDEYRSIFRHTLWVIPGVKEANALKDLLRQHPVFWSWAFKIVNVAGNDDEEIDQSDALQELKKAMWENPEETSTITLTCWRLTTWVTVPEWTAVLMLAWAYSTDAKQYLQTIFRVQSPANIWGKIKENAYVFDFAPDRTLKMVADAVRQSARKRKPEVPIEHLMWAFLNFCPVIAYDQSKMTEFKTEQLMQELKKAYAERVVNSGFEDAKLYNDELLKLDWMDIAEFEDLKKIVWQAKQNKWTDKIVLNEMWMTEEEREQVEQIEKKQRQKQPLTEEEKEKLKELRKAKDNRTKAISILRCISIRIPLLVYGIDKDINYDIKIDEFADMIDQSSWDEFMPKWVSKDLFKKFIKYYDKDIFVASCRKIRYIALSADELEPTERVKKITLLLGNFKNPDKETVLTPRKVVNMHMSETVWWYDFYNEEDWKELEEPKHTKTFITNEVFNKDTKVLEINSKTGLYPLYITYSIYRDLCKNYEDKELTLETKNKIWDSVVENNVYIVCKTPMAKSITKRTLTGYRDVKCNTHSFDDLIMQFKDKPEKVVSKIKSNSCWWKKGDAPISFNAVVWNPPYQWDNHSQIYPYFYLASKTLWDNVSLIFPTWWQEPKNANNLSKLNNEEVKYDNQIVFIDNRQNVFPGISWAERTNVILWKKNYDNWLKWKQLILTNWKEPEEKELLIKAEQIEKPKDIVSLASIVKGRKDFVSIAEITSTRKPYWLTTDVIKDYKKFQLSEEQNKKSDIKIYAKSWLILYASEGYKFPKASKALNKYKVFIPYAWWNMSDNGYLWWAFSDIIIWLPNEACTETYLESWCFDDYETAKKHAKYLMTKFCRALLFMNKTSQHSTTSRWAIPQQDYSEARWDKSIKEINDELFKKYKIPEDVMDYVNKNIQTRNESNILNYK